MVWEVRKVEKEKKGGAETGSIAASGFRPPLFTEHLLDACL